MYKSKAYFIFQDTTILNVNFKCPWSGQQPCKVPQGQSKVKCFIFSVQVSRGNKCEYQTNWKPNEICTKGLETSPRKSHILYRLLASMHGLWISLTQQNLTWYELIHQSHLRHPIMQLLCSVIMLNQTLIFKVQNSKGFPCQSDWKCHLKCCLPVLNGLYPY